MQDRKQSRVLLAKYIELADLVMKFGGHVSFEWPRHCAGWILPELMNFIARWDLYSAPVDGCAAGVISSNGSPIRKPWLFVTSSQQQATALSAFHCTHKPGEHVEAAGKETKNTEIYPLALATAMLESLFPHSGRIPAMTCQPALPSEVHIPKETKVSGFVPSPFMWSEIFEINARRRGTESLEHDELLGCAQAIRGVTNTTDCLSKRTNIAVTKSLTREEITRCPEVQQAIKQEAKGLLDLNTWDQDSHRDKEDLIKEAIRTGIKIIIGDLVILGSIKFVERA